MHEVKFRRNSQELAEGFHGTEYKNTLNRKKTTPQQEHTTYVTDSEEAHHQETTSAFP